MKMIWNKDGPAWSSEGVLHAQSFLMLWVAKEIPAATRAPMKYRALNSEVMIGRSLGYASSPIKEEPAMIQKGMPNPRNHRATTYMAARNVRHKMWDSQEGSPTSVGESLKTGAKHHNPRPYEDRPSTAKRVIQHRHEGERAYRP